ncbi:MAG: 23S rRNA (pseudouridine(1915)-N(3))-methyltransferase RlmH [Paludibacteraceae bacterium]|nr:23S rRNA (pseudouridine(1915)-N(3))-methyltransferase RlmH [Paludibacteraceae bacterium]
MKITLLVVGKTTDQRLVSLIEDYRQRLTHYVPFDLVVIPDLKNTKGLSESQIKTTEGNEILRYLRPSAEAVLLDEHGREFRSVEFADWLQKRMSSGRDLTLVIGGPYGFSPEVYQRANTKISLSQMTFSHQMVRLFTIEQLYRAMTILRNEPYHHE